MASTRHPPPLQVYQDPIDSSHNEDQVHQTNRDDSSTTQPKQLQPSLKALQPLRNATANRDFGLTPPSNASQRRSPSPVKNQPQAPNASHFISHLPPDGPGYVPITAPKPTSFQTDSPPKPSPQYYHYGPDPSFIAQHALFTTFSSVPQNINSQSQRQPSVSAYSVGNENPQPPTYGKTANTSTTRTTTTNSLGDPATGKRTLMEAAPLKERPAKKQRRDEAEPVQLPDPQSMPSIDDDGTKPPYSYAVLIGMAILRSPNRRLTLAQIYKWISDTFSFYRAGDSGWQNSIRHNLSLNKAFVKQERPKDDPGKGNYWAIVPGMEAQFLKDRPLRRPATMATMPLPLPASSTNSKQPKSEIKQPQAAVNATTYMLPPASRPPQAKSNNNVNNTDISSDATLTASDPALQEDSGDETVQAASRPTLAAPYSSPPRIMGSSPPVTLAPPPPPKATFTRQATPPTPSRPSSATTAIARPRKRNATTLDDSGYFSSLESSAMRPQKARRISTSEIDIEPPRIKRGRAEEEIARIRSSSHDISPIRPGTHYDPVNLTGSSPVLAQQLTVDPPQPLTPGIKLKKAAKSPASLSPNTQLRNHRRKIQQLVKSPTKHLHLVPQHFPPWSPSMKIAKDPCPPSGGDNLQAPSFDVYTDIPATISTPTSGSPVKDTTKPQVHDPFESSILFDITALDENTTLDTPSEENPKHPKGMKYPIEPPKQHPNDALRYIDATDDDEFSFDMFNHFNDEPEPPNGELDGVDLLRGFEKIGKSKGSAKPMVFGYPPLPPHCARY